MKLFVGKPSDDEVAYFYLEQDQDGDVALHVSIEGENHQLGYFDMDEDGRIKFEGFTLPRELFRIRGDEDTGVLEVIY